MQPGETSADPLKLPENIKEKLLKLELLPMVLHDFSVEGQESGLIVAAGPSSSGCAGSDAHAFMQDG